MNSLVGFYLIGLKDVARADVRPFAGGLHLFAGGSASLRRRVCVFRQADLYPFTTATIPAYFYDGLEPGRCHAT